MKGWSKCSQVILSVSFTFFFPLSFGPSAQIDRKMESLHFLWLCYNTQIIRTALPKTLNTYSHSDEIRLTVLTCDLCYRGPQTRWEVLFPSAFVHTCVMSEEVCMEIKKWKSVTSMWFKDSCVSTIKFCLVG